MPNFSSLCSFNGVEVECIPILETFGSFVWEVPKGVCVDSVKLVICNILVRFDV